MAILVLVIGIILFIGLIVIHEFGHFILARRNGVVAEEFAIFFGPTLYQHKTKSGWIFKINLLPLGGYVKLKGEHDSDTEPGSYGAASLWVKTKIMAAGVFANLIIGLILLTFLALIGMPQLIQHQFSIASDAHIIKQQTSSIEVASVLNNSPAEKAGLKSGDQITSIGIKNQMNPINSFADLQNITKKYAGQLVQIDIIRSNKKMAESTLLNSTNIVEHSQSKVYLGVSVGIYNKGFNLIRYTWSAPIVALGTTKQVVTLTFKGLGDALKGLGGIIAGTATNNPTARKNAQSSASNQLVGPVGIFVILKDGSSAGIQFMLFIIAIISLTLAIMNILPIPALDGGRLWLTLITRSIRKPLNAHNEELINAVGMLVLFLLLGVVTYIDIRRFF